ncbi:hypothetical protein GCM10010295_01230 [Streptomyces intermedius]
MLDQAGKPPALIPVTKAEKDETGSARTGPDWILESRTGTTPWEATRLAATSTQLPPLVL